MTQPDISGLTAYEFSREGTGLGVGWFTCLPKGSPGFPDCLHHLHAHPHDQFMHRHLLSLAGNMDPDEVRSLTDAGREGDPLLMAAMYEACLLNDKFSGMLDRFAAVDLKTLRHHSPFVHIAWSMRKNRAQTRYWQQQFSKNANLLAPLPDPSEAAYPPLYDMENPLKGTVTAKDLWTGTTRAQAGPRPALPRKWPKELTQKMEHLGILAGWESRSDTTLSPYAIERPWNLNITVADGANRYRLTGTPVSYGRGMNIHQARMSCLMETVERHAAFAGFLAGKAVGYKKDLGEIKASHKHLLAQGLEALDPNALGLEVPYENQSILWVRGQRRHGGGLSPVLVPAQFVFLFPNFDEPALTSGLPSNGLASGLTPEEARLSSLLEVIERDAEKVVAYSKKRCFLLESRDPKIHDLLEGYARKGLQIQLLDITSEFGIPCYRAFLQSPGGHILKGSAAHLDGRRAAVAALTEIPYPYPYWFGAMPAPDGLEIRELESLPNFSTGDPDKDLRFLENLLLENGLHPIHVDLTRDELDLPVVKSLIPGLEMLTVWDLFTPLSRRQFAHYRKWCEERSKTHAHLPRSGG